MNTRMSASERTATPSRPPRRQGTRVLLLVAAVVILVVGAAVAVRITSDGNSGVAPIPTNEGAPTSVGSTAPATSLDARGAAKAAVIDAYKRSYQGYIAVGKEASPNPNDPRLIQYSTGTALLAKQKALADNKGKGLILSGEAELHPTVIELAADTATVVDCAIDRTALVDSRTGSIAVGAGNGEGGAVTAKLTFEGGAWKVSSFKDEKRTCVPPAA